MQILSNLNFIDGQYVPSASLESIEVLNPSTGEILGSVPDSTVEEGEAALLAARAAQKDWAVRPPRDRVRILRKLADEIRARSDELAELLVREQGKILALAHGEVEATATFIEYACDMALQVEGDIIASDLPGERIYIHNFPRGVVVAITAWNFPLALAGRKIGPALVAGNAVVLKPTEETPLATMLLGEIANKAGLPAGLLNIVNGSGARVGNHLCQNQHTDMITMTGSTPAGQKIYQAAGKHLIPVMLELGGKAPFVVMEDADIDLAVSSLIGARFTNTGQVCTCAERVYVQESIYDAFVARISSEIGKLIVGDPMDEATDIGPKVNRNEVANLDRIVSSSLSQGATLVCGGGAVAPKGFEGGFFYQPTLLTDLDQSNIAVQEETFGPILPVLKFGSLDEVIALANDSEYGLAAYFYSDSHQNIYRFINEVEAGEMYINRGMGEQHQGFHNGWKMSGLGGEDGRYGLEQYFIKKTVYLSEGS